MSKTNWLNLEIECREMQILLKKPAKVSSRENFLP